MPLGAGPINSWDRQPFLTDISGADSFESVPTHVQQNLIFANYGAAQGFDTDDGSSFYRIHDNVIHDNVIYAADGLKMDCESPRHDLPAIFSSGTRVYQWADGSIWVYLGLFGGADGGHDSDFYSNLVVTNPYDGQNCFDVGSFKPVAICIENDLFCIKHGGLCI